MVRKESLAHKVASIVFSVLLTLAFIPIPNMSQAYAVEVEDAEDGTQVQVVETDPGSPDEVVVEDVGVSDEADDGVTDPAPTYTLQAVDDEPVADDTADEGDGYTLMASNTETVTIGTGAQATAYAPLRNRDSNGQTQAIYTADEIGASGTITSLAYNVSGTNASYSITNLRIWMGYTSLSKFTSVNQALGASDLTLVYDGVPSPMLGSASGWQALQLTTPFDYDAGNGNLVVVVGTQSTKYQSSVTFCYTTTSGTVLTRGNDSAATVADLDYSGTVAYTLRDDRPNIQLTIDVCDHAGATLTSTVDPTCTEQGYSNYHCDTCGKDVKMNDVDALGHSWGEPFRGDKDGTANENGKYNVYVCTRDSSHIKTESADPTVWDGAESTMWEHGSGTQSDPYLIESAANLVYLRDQVNAGSAANSTNLGMYSDTYFKQTVDIDLSDVTWTPIGVYASGTTTRAFSGHYDGGGHAISGLKVNHTATTSSSGAGLFAYVKGNASTRASVEGVVVEGSVASTGTTGYTAGLIGYSQYTDIKNCGNEATVTAGYHNVAGITGACYYSTIDGCYNHGDVTSNYTTGGAYAAGISAANGNYPVSITNCYNTGDITSNYYAGGIASQMYGGSTTATHNYENCYNTGTITATTTGTNADVAGGIIGYISSGGATYASAQTMTNCFTLVNAAPQALIGNNQPAYMTITNSGERTDDYMKSGDLVTALGEKFIKGADYPMLYWEAPSGIPVITTQPEDAAYVKDATAAALSITAEGDAASGELVYQWYKATKADLSDASAISGATTSTYTPATDTLGDFYYYCVVHNDVQALDGSGPYLVQSNAAHVQVWSGATAVAPTITTQPASIDEIGQTESTGNDLTVAAQFAGEDETTANCALSYQWQVSDSADGTFSDVEGATEATFAAPTAQVGTKYYRCVVTTTREGQSSASTTSDVASVTVVGLAISTQEQLKSFASAVDAGSDFTGCTVTLAADIEVTGSWNPIGEGATSILNWKSFNGEFDGDGHTITFNAGEDASGYYALFGATGTGASIHDLVVAGTMTSSSTTVAGVVAQVQGATTLERVGNEANVTSGAVNYATLAANTGGLVGCVSNESLAVTDCYNKGAIAGQGSRMGGLVANIAASSTKTVTAVTITSSYNTGTVTNTNSSTDASGIGGIYGAYTGTNATLKNCYNAGAVTITSNASSTSMGAITGATSAINPADNDVCYWLDTSNARARGGTSTQPAGFVSKTADEFADETGDTGVLALLAVGDYADAWIAGSGLDPAQASPALAWEKAQEAAKHVVTFDANGGTLAEGAEATVEVEDGGTVAKPADPTYGTTRLFDGWYNGDAEYDFTAAVTDDITLTAKWSNKRTISITVQSAPADAKMVYTDEKTGESTEFTNKQAMGANVMFLSTLNPGSYYGTHDATVTVSANGYEDYVIESPGKDGTNNITKSFKMTPVSYDITYNLDGGTNAEANPAIYTIETDTIALADPSKDGFDFGGWYANDEFTGDAVTEIAKGSTGAVTLYAKWTEKPSERTSCQWYLEPAGENSYVIETASELAEFATIVNGTVPEDYDIDQDLFAGKTVTLGADIDLEDEAFAPIGGQTAAFAGTFDGAGKTISGLNVSTSTGYTGLFGQTANTATIKDFTVSGAITKTGSSGDYVGVVGYNKGRIEGVYSSVVITASNTYNVGGIAGFNDGGRIYAGDGFSGAFTTTDGQGYIYGCLVTGAVTGYQKVGGIAGEQSGSIDSCVVTSKVDGINAGSKNGVGGIAGRNGNNDSSWYCAHINNCLFAGTVGRSGQKWTGGIAGLENGTYGASQGADGMRHRTVDGVDYIVGSNVTNSYMVGVQLGNGNYNNAIIGNYEGYYDANNYRLDTITNNTGSTEGEIGIAATAAEFTGGTFSQTLAGDGRDWIEYADANDAVKAAMTAAHAGDRTNYPVPLAFKAGGDNATITGIADNGENFNEDSSATEAVFVNGQKFSVGDYKLQCNYSDGSRTIIRDYTVKLGDEAIDTSYAFASADDGKTLTISYTDPDNAEMTYTKSWTVSIVAETPTGITVAGGAPQSYVYMVGQTIDPKNLVANVPLTNGTTASLAYGTAENLVLTLTDGEGIVETMAGDYELTVADSGKKLGMSYTLNGETVSLANPMGELVIVPAVDQIDGIYQIKIADDLRWFSAEGYDGSREDCNTVSAVLANDIDLSEIDWIYVPAGYQASANTYYNARWWRGTFDGQGHTVTFNDNGGPLLGYAQGATVKDVTVAGSISGGSSVAGVMLSAGNGTTITNCVNNANITATGNWAGGVVATMNSANVTVSDCTNNGIISGSNAGGIIGNAAQANGTFENCVNNGAVKGGNTVGGIVGTLSGSGTKAANCVNNAEVTGGNNVGGIVGSFTGGTAESCINKASVTATGSPAGSIAGVFGNATIAKCGNYGDVTSTSGTSGVGGIVGSQNNNTSGTITSSFNRADVSGLGNVGGVAGNIPSTSNGTSRLTLTDVYSTGDVTATAGSETTGVGGILGTLQGTTYRTNAILAATNVYNAGAVTSEDAAPAAAVVGYVYANSRSASMKATATVTLDNACYLDSAAEAAVGGQGGSNNTITIDGEATAKTADELKADDMPATLDAEAFKLDALGETAINKGYPILEWEPDAVTPVNVTFDSQGGSAVQAQTAYTTRLVAEPEEPTAAGKFFAGWYTDEECTEGSEFDFSAPLASDAEDFTLYAKWDTGARIMVVYTPSTAGAEVSIVDTTDESDVEGTAHGGWVLTGYVNATHAYTYTVEAEGFDTITGTIDPSEFEELGDVPFVVFAPLEAQTYTVAFDSAGGTDVAVQTVEYGKTASEPSAPNLACGVFAGWTLDGEAYDFATPVTGDITLIANWTATHQYRTYDGDKDFCSVCGTYNPDAATYHIDTPARLAEIARAVNAGDSLEGKTVVLENDIRLGDYADWAPIGNASTAFAGTFDGQGYEIKDLVIASGGGYKGLFGNNAGTVRDFTITGSIGAEGAYVGGNDFYGVVALNTGTVSGVVSSLQIFPGVSDTYAVGGVVGKNQGGTVSRCGFDGAIASDTSKSVFRTGGVVGFQSAGSITECYNHGTVSAWNYRNGNQGTGGILGSMDGGTVSYCYNTANVYNGDGSSALGGKQGCGGIVGAISAGSVDHCYATGDSFGPGSAGVIIGKVGNGTYSNLYSLDTARSWQQYGTKTADNGIKYCDGTDENADGSIKFGGAALANSYNSGYTISDSWTKTADELASPGFVTTIDDGTTSFSFDSFGINDGASPTLTWEGGEQPLVATIELGANVTSDPEVDGTLAFVPEDGFSITFAPAEGYLLDEAPVVTGEDVDGIDVVDNGDGTYTVSGTSESEVNVSIADAVADTTALEEAIAAATEDLEGTTVSEDGSDVTPGDEYALATDAQTLQDAIDAAKAVADDPSASAEDIAAAVADLTAAQEAFDNAKQEAGTPDKLDLAIAIADGQHALIDAPQASADGTDVPDGEQYVSPEAVKALEDAIDAAKAVLADETATQADVDAAKAAVEDATQALADATKTASVDKSALTSAIAAAKAAESGTATSTDGSNVADGKKWTTAAEKKAEDNAIAAAQKVADNAKATQAQVDAAAAAVKKATSTYNSAKKLWHRIWGKTAPDTMKSIASRFGKAKVAIVTTDANYKDALAASALAGNYNAIVLMTKTGSLTAQTKAAMKAAGVDTVCIVGSTSEVSAATQSAIAKVSGVKKVTRVNGSSASARAIAAAKVVGKKSDTVIIATQNGFEDALSIAPYSYATKSPILYAETSKKLSSATTAYIKSAGYKKAIVVGGPIALPASIDSQLKSAGVTQVTRLAGANSYATSDLIAKWSTGKLSNKSYGTYKGKALAYVKFQPSTKMSADRLAVSTGQNWLDALAGAALCGKNRSVLLLADAKTAKSNYTLAPAFCKSNKASIKTEAYVFGGTSAVSPAVWNALVASTK